MEKIFISSSKLGEKSQFIIKRIIEILLIILNLTLVKLFVTI